MKLLLTGVVSLMAVACTSAPANRLGSAMGRIGASGQFSDASYQRTQSELAEIPDLADAELGDLEGLADAEHDRYAQLVPLAELAKARLAARLGQIPEAERACWRAIELAEDHVGTHIRRMSEDDEDGLFLSCGAHFRREKIRRAAFAMLTEAYRKAGEKDLEQLAQLQVATSSLYLTSKTAHGEEERVRGIEGSVWAYEYETTRANANHETMMIMMALMAAASTAANQYSAQQADMAAMRSTNSQQASSFRSQAAQLRTNDTLQQMQYREQMRQAGEQHFARMTAWAAVHSRDLSAAAITNATILRLSAAVRALPGYQKLVAAQQKLDNYLTRGAFDEGAARALATLRQSLDELSRDVQSKRQGTRK